MKRNNELNKLLEILQKHIIIKENPKEDALDIYIKCNGISIVTLPRNYIRSRHFDSFTGRIIHDCDNPSQDTLDLEIFKKLVCNSENIN